MSASFRARVLQVVRAIPPGKVATYGDVATLAGQARAARAVGTILRNGPGDPSEIPWHRVINGKGEISGGGDVIRPGLQYELLIAEGVVFNALGKIDLRAYRWDLRDAPRWDP